MYDAALSHFEKADVGILCAAVADFKPVQAATTKIKREGNEWSIHLQPTPDIAATLGERKTKAQRLVGFALETDNEEVNARRKLETKHLDFIVLNSTRNAGTTFQSDDNQITIITKSACKSFEKKPKTAVARDIIDELCRTF